MKRITDKEALRIAWNMLRQVPDAYRNPKGFAIVEKAMKSKPIGITDKQRLDWLQKSKMTITCIEGNIDKSWEEEGVDLRQAIDAAIKQGLLGRKGKE